MELSWPLVLAAALALVFIVMIVRGRGQSLTEEQRARTRRFLEINERMSVLGAAGVAGLCAVGAVVAGLLGEWRFAGLLLAGVAVFVALGLGQRWWHQRALRQLDEG